MKDRYSEQILDERLGEDGSEIHHFYASKGIRFIHVMLDSFLFLILTALLLSTIMINIAAALSAKFFVFYFIYFSCWFAFEFSLGKTPSKYITGTKVVMADGGAPTFNAILIRTLCRLIPFEAFSFLNMDGLGWHDSISKTRVVKNTFKQHF